MPPTKSCLFRALGLVCGALTFAVGIPGSIEAASFTPLGDLPGGDSFSRAYGVSANGSAVVGQSIGASGGEAFRWTSGGGMVGLGDLPGLLFDSIAWGVSADGAVVVGRSFAASGQEAFRWTSGSGMVGLGVLSGGSFFSTAKGVSADGSVVVGSSEGSSGQEAFRWTSGGGMVGLGYLPGAVLPPFGFSSEASAVSADGSVVVGSSTGPSATTEAFRWTSGGGMVGLGDLPGGGFRSFASAVSADGSVVVGGIVSTFIGPSPTGEAFRWTSGGGMVGLGDLPGGAFRSFANGVSADGAVVVGTSDAGPGLRAFLWDSVNGIRNLQDVLVADFGLDLTGWTLEEATAISGDGLKIVGYGTNPNGNSEAWLADLTPSPVPEPGSLTLLGLGTAGLAFVRLAKRRRNRNGAKWCRDAVPAVPAANVV